MKNYIYHNAIITYLGISVSVRDLHQKKLVNLSALFCVSLHIGGLAIIHYTYLQLIDIGCLVVQNVIR